MLKVFGYDHYFLQQSIDSKSYADAAVVWFDMDVTRAHRDCAAHQRVRQLYNGCAFDDFFQFDDVDLVFVFVESGNFQIGRIDAPNGFADDFPQIVICTEGTENRVAHVLFGCEDGVDLKSGDRGDFVYCG